LLYPLSGILLGIIAHPASWNYSRIIFIHVFKVLFLRFSGIDLGIGEEVRFHDNFLLQNFLPVIFYIVSLSAFLAFKNLRKKSETKILFIASLIWFLINLLVPRAVEYWFPLALIFSAMVINDFQTTDEYKYFLEKSRSIINVPLVLFFIISSAGIMIFHNFSEAYSNLMLEKQDNLLDSVSAVNGWLLKNTPAGSAVFYDDWFYWPTMFYFNHGHNSFLLGMDPTFTYEYSHEIFWTWHNLSLFGFYCDNNDFCPDISPKNNIILAKDAFQNKFKTGFIMVTKSKDNKLYDFINLDKDDYQKAFDDSRLTIFTVKP
jgi:hypothetical protein